MTVTVEVLLNGVRVPVELGAFDQDARAVFVPGEPARREQVVDALAAATQVLRGLADRQVGGRRLGRLLALGERGRDRAEGRVVELETYVRREHR